MCTVCAPSVHRVCTVGPSQKYYIYSAAGCAPSVLNLLAHSLPKTHYLVVKQGCAPSEPSQPEGSQYLASGRLEAGLGQVCVKAIIQIQISICFFGKIGLKI